MVEYNIHTAVDEIVSSRLQRELKEEVLDAIPGPSFNWGDIDKIDKTGILDKSRALLNFAQATPKYKEVMLDQLARAVDPQYAINKFSIIDDITLLQLLVDRRGDGGIFGDNAIQTVLDTLNVIVSYPFGDGEVEARIKSEAEERYGVKIELREGVHVLIG